MARRRSRKAPPGQLEFDLWGLAEQTADEQISEAAETLPGVEGAEREQVRGTGDAALEDARTGTVQADREPDPVLHRAGLGGARPDHRTDTTDRDEPPLAAGHDALFERDLYQGRGTPDDGATDSGGGRDAATRLGHRPEPAAGRGPSGVEPDLPERREPDHVGRANAGRPRSDALDGRPGAEGQRLGSATLVLGGHGRSGDPEAVSGRAPEPAGGGSDDPLPARSPLTLTADDTGPEPAATVLRFVPATHDDLAPSGAKARFHANIAAIETARLLAEQERPATTDEQQVLARWSSWGAVPDVFDESKTDWTTEREQLRSLLTPDEWDAAARTTINAHYTDPMIVRQMWRAMTALGFDGGRVLEPGSGLGTFLGMAPERARMTGVELDPVTAAISRALYPHAEVRGESFADTRLPEASFDAAIGNVPFSDVTLHDPVHNPTRQSMHNHFIVKSLRLTRPGGMVAALTSQYTMDAQTPGARREMAMLADLVGAVRLPAGAHRRTAGTDVVTDLLILRRREVGQPPADDLWETVTPISLDGQAAKINAYFDHHPEHVLGTLSIRQGMYGRPTVTVDGDLDRRETDLADVLDQITCAARRRNLAFTAPTAEHQARQAAHVPSPPQLWDGSIVATDTGFGTVVQGSVEPLDVPKSAGPELRALLGLRDGAHRLLELERSAERRVRKRASSRAR